MVDRRKIVPFPYKFIPIRDVELINYNNTKITLLAGNLIVKEDNPILKYKGLEFVGIIKDDKGTNSVLVYNVLFDPRDNSMAVRLNGVLNLLDYEKIKEEISNSSKVKAS